MKWEGESEVREKLDSVVLLWLILYRSGFHIDDAPWM